MSAWSPSAPLVSLSCAAQSFEDLEEIRARLVRAQQEENCAFRKLGELTQNAHAEQVAVDFLLAEARMKRARSIAAYEAWSRAIEQAQGSIDGIAAESVRSGRP